MRILTTVAVAGFCASALGASPAAAAASRKPTNIPAEELRVALQSLASERDFQLVYRSEVVGGRRTRGAQGDLTMSEALSQILEGTGLTYDYLSETAVTIVPVAGAAPERTQPAAPAQPQKDSSPDSAMQEGQAQRRWFRLAQAAERVDSSAGSTLAGDASRGSESSRGTLEEIVVTAQKRTENVQDVPKSISVATPEQLARAGATRLGDLAQVVPSIAGTTTLNAAPPIRGIASFALSIGVQAQTGIVVDDIPQPTFSALANELTGIERVEVFAGPQSTLSGRNAAGGLINIVTKSPSRDPQAELNVEQTNDRQTRVNTYVSGPLGDRVAASLSAFLNEWDGPVTSVGEDGLRLNGWDTKGARGKLLWEMTDTLSATLTAYTLRNESLNAGVFTSGPYVYFAPDARYLFDTQGRTFQQLFPGVEASPFNTAIGSTRHSRSRTHDRGGTLRLEYDLGAPGVLTSLTNYSKADLPRIDNFFGVPTDGLFFPVSDPYARADYRTTYKTQEIRLASPGAQTVTYLLGAIYSDTDTDHPYARLGVFPVDWYRQSAIESVAAFGRATWQFLPNDSITAGVRYQSDELGYRWMFLPTVPNGVTTLRAGDSAYDFWSGELSFQHRFSDDVQAYVTVASSETGEAYDFEDSSGALSPQGLQPLTSEEVTNVEVGVKSQWLDRRLTLNINAFLAKYKNYQIQSIGPSNDPNAAPTIRLYAIGRVETKGVELTGLYYPTDDLNFAFSAAYLDAGIEDYPNAECYVRQTAALGCDPSIGNLQRNLAGATMPNTPKFKYTLAANYTLPLSAPPFDVELGAFYRRQSKVNFDLLGSPIAVQDAYGVLNLTAGISDRDGRYTLTAFINNVLKERYYASLADDLFFTGSAHIASYGRDSFRYGGLRLNVSF